MKFAIGILLSAFLLISDCLMAQVKIRQFKNDSTFSLGVSLRKDRKNIGQQGLQFNEADTQVVKDFDHFRRLSLTDLSTYQGQIKQEDRHFIKIWTPKKFAGNILKIVEINSVYPVDSLEENGTRYK